MAHECPECGTACICQGDIDPEVVDGVLWECCEHCDAYLEDYGLDEEFF